MATWRQLDQLETTQAKAGAEMTEFCSRLTEIDRTVSEIHGQKIMDIARTLNDAMRDARRAAQDVVVSERGWRK